jgi:phage shock protein A
MLSKKTIEAMSYAFEMERSSYQRTILDMKNKIEGLDKNKDYNEQMLALRDATIEKLESKIEQLEQENLKLSDIHNVEQLAHDTDLAAENDKLKEELHETKATLKKYMASSAGLNAKQKLEYKRLKQNEYQRRWLKNKAKKNK